MLRLKSITSVIICVIFVALFAVNCDKNPTKPVEERLVGTWELTKLTVTSQGATMTLDLSELQQSGFSVTLNISNDDTYTWTQTDEGVTTVETGTWSVSGKSLTTASSDGETTTFQFTLSDNKLTLKFSEDIASYTFELTRQ